MKTISFVIPLYNEEGRLNKTFEALDKLLLPRGLKLDEIIFVNDGSRDKTAKLVSKFKKGSRIGRYVHLVSYDNNQGKGHAIKTGMLESKADYTLFFDADMSTPLSEIQNFMPYIKNNIDVIIGTRKNSTSTVLVHQPKYREILGKGFTIITQIALNLDVTDFTCGFKAFSKNSIKKVFENSKISGWGYDAEIIFLAKKYGYSINEEAVIWSNDERTKVKIYKAVPQTFMELWQIRWLHSFKPVLAHALAPQRAILSRLSSLV